MAPPELKVQQRESRLDEGMIADDNGNIFSDDVLFVGSINTQVNAEDETQNERILTVPSSNSGEPAADTADVAHDTDEEEEDRRHVCLL